MTNFELLKKSLKKVDQQNLNHASQESVPWAGENQDGELRQNLLRCATRCYVEKCCLAVACPGEADAKSKKPGDGELPVSLGWLGRAWWRPAPSTVETLFAGSRMTSEDPDSPSDRAPPA